jgi:hypothetical protein
MADQHGQNRGRGDRAGAAPLRSDLDPLGAHDPFNAHGEASEAGPPRYMGSAPGYGSHGMGYGPQSGSQSASFGAYGVPRDVAADYVSVSRSGPPGRFDQPHGRVGFGWEGSYGSQGDFSSFAESIGPRADAAGRGGDWQPQQRQERASRSQRRGPKNYVRSDERIQEDLCERLAHMQHIDTNDVTIEVKGAKVTLYGTVPHRQMKHWIEDFVADYAGVTEVENKLRVALTAALPQDQREPWR